MFTCRQGSTYAGPCYLSHHTHISTKVKDQEEPFKADWKKHGSREILGNGTHSEILIHKVIWPLCMWYLCSIMCGCIFSPYFLYQLHIINRISSADIWQLVFSFFKKKTYMQSENALAYLVHTLRRGKCSWQLKKQMPPRVLAMSTFKWPRTNANRKLNLFPCCL